MNLFKRKRAAPACVSEAISNAEWLMAKYTASELRRYRTAFDNKLDRLINAEIEKIEDELKQLKQLL